MTSSRRGGTTLIELVLAIAVATILLVVFGAWAHRMVKAVKATHQGLDVRAPLTLSWLRISQVLQETNSQGVQVAENAKYRVLSVDTIREASSNEYLWANELQVFRWDREARRLEYFVLSSAALQESGLSLNEQNAIVPTPEELLLLAANPKRVLKSFELDDVQFQGGPDEALRIALTSTPLSQKSNGITLTRVYNFRR